MTPLPWAFAVPPFFGRRCKARLTPNDTGYHGRCELIKHSKKLPHALERGMIWVRWTDSPITFEEPHH